MKPKSQIVQRLEQEVHELQAYQEAFWCMQRGEKPLHFSSGEDDRKVSIELLGAHRASGGVVIIDGSVHYATDWVSRARESSDAYVRDVARQVERAQGEAAKAA